MRGESVERKSFYEIVNPVLEARGISKGAFCRAIGVHPNMYPKYRNGVEPRVDVIRAAEQFLQINILGNEQEKPATESDGKYEFLISLIDRLPFEKQVELTNWIQAELRGQSVPGDPEAQK